MKNLIASIEIAPVTLAVVFAALTGMFWLITLLEYTLHMPLFTAVLLSIFISVTVISLTKAGVRNRKKHAVGVRILSAMSPLLAIFFIVGMVFATSMHPIIYFLLFLVVFICSIVLFFSCTQSLAVKIALGVIYFLAALLICLFLFMLAFFTVLFDMVGGTGSNEVVQYEFSPHGTHLAEIINSDHGAISSATFIHITQQRRNVNLFFAELRKNPIRVYSGRWGEFNLMALYWESDTVLRVYFRDDVMVFTRTSGGWVRS